MADRMYRKSTFPTRNQLTAAIDRVLKPYLDKSRAIVLVGHDIEQDLRYLESVGMRIRELKGASRMADSQLLHQSWKQDNNGRGLSSVLADLGIESRNLHNAGNDAVYTLRALMGVAIETHRQQEVEAAGGTYEPPF